MLKVEMDAVTPIWSGDAWGRSETELRPTTLLGSLRYWLKVICHAAALPVRENEILDYNKFNKDVWECLHADEHKSMDEIKIKAAAKQLSIPSLVFGCTGWQGLIQIDYIKTKDSGGWKDFNVQVICKKIICKNNKNDEWEKCNEWKKCSFAEWNKIQKSKKQKKTQKSKKQNEKLSGWFIITSEIRKVEVGFRVSPEIKDRILIPLLDFIQQYGYIGAKNNLGFGRVRFDKLQPSSSSCIDFSHFDKGKVNFAEIIDENIQDFEELKTCEKIGLYKLNDETNLEDAIFNLIKEKAKERRKVISADERHQLFGYVEISNKENEKNKETEDKTEGTKIIPWINKKGNGYETGFLSVAFLSD